jgi:hypothetical protein
MGTPCGLIRRKNDLIILDNCNPVVPPPTSTTAPAEIWRTLLAAVASSINPLHSRPAEKSTFPVPDSCSGTPGDSNRRRFQTPSETLLNLLLELGYEPSRTEKVNDQPIAYDLGLTPAARNRQHLIIQHNQ